MSAELNMNEKAVMGTGEQDQVQSIDSECLTRMEQLYKGKNDFLCCSTVR